MTEILDENSEGCTVTHLAELFNLSERRIQQLAKEGVLQRTRHGHYDLIPCVRNYIAYLQEQVQIDTSGADKAAIHHYKAELLRLQTEQKTLQLAYEKGQLISLEAARQEWVRQILNARAKLLALPHKVVIQFHAGEPSELEAIVRDLIYEALTEMSEMEEGTIQNPPFESLTFKVAGEVELPHE